MHLSNITQRTYRTASGRLAFQNHVAMFVQGGVGEEVWRMVATGGGWSLRYATVYHMWMFYVPGH